MNYLGKESTIHIGGRPIRVARFDISVLNRWMAWAKTQLPNPLELLAPILKDLAPSVQEKLVAEAYVKASARLDFFSPEIQNVMNSLDGMGKLMCCLFQVHQPQLTDDEAWELFQAGLDEYGDDKFRELITTAQGTVPVDAGAAEEQVYRERGLIPPGSKKNEPSDNHLPQVTPRPIG
jgi:hypothetical protein